MRVFSPTTHSVRFPDQARDYTFVDLVSDATGTAVAFWMDYTPITSPETSPSDFRALGQVISAEGEVGAVFEVNDPTEQAGLPAAASLPNGDLVVSRLRWTGEFADPTDVRTVARRYRMRPEHFERSIEIGDDDVEETTRSSGRPHVQRRSSDLDLQKGVRVGLRFSGVEIPQGARIVSARLELVSDETRDGVLQVAIAGEATDHASSVTNKSPLTGRSRTESVPWDVEPDTARRCP